MFAYKPTALLAAALGLASVGMALHSPAAAAQDLGVSISIGQPGFYGSIDLGDAPPPRMIYREPIVVERVREYEPIYLRVPPGHAKHWRKHCHEYDACGRRVYFVRDDWYNRVYVPHYREVHGDRGWERRDGDRDDDHDEGHGHGRGHGHGHGHDRDDH